MARTELRGGDQIKNFTVLKEDLVLDFLGGSNWDISNGGANATITGLADGVNATDAATKGQLDAALAGLNAGLEYKGVFDASTPSPDLDAQANSKGDFYKVSVAGTYLGISLAVGDMLYFNKDVPALTTVTAADLDKIDNTESPDLLRDADIVDSLLSTDATKVLSANQGYVLKGLIDALDAEVNTRAYSENKTITNNSAVLPALVNTPVAGTERVYLNGLRMERGAGNDYTISGSVITFEYPMKTNDKVLVDYEY